MRVDLDETGDQGRVPLGQLPQRVREQGPAGGGEGGDDQPAGDRVPVCGQGRLRLVDRGQHPGRVLGQDPTRVGQPQPPAVLLDQCGLGLTL
jgi:hypothetical protein